MELKVKPMGMVSTNVIFYYNDKDGILVDPSEDASTIIQFIKDKNIPISKILLTHGHFDHIGAVNELRAELNIPAAIFECEKDLAQNPDFNGSNTMNRSPIIAEIDETFTDGKVLDFDGFSLKVINTPGHTKGSCCFYDAENGNLFSGDTLFQLSIGRTDFPTGDYSEIISSIKEKLFILPEETKVYPGHGPATTIKKEKTSNPFVK